MLLTIDSAVASRNKLTMSQLLVCLAACNIKAGTLKDQIQDLIKRGFLEQTEEDLIPTENCIRKVCNKKCTKADLIEFDKDLTSLAEKLRLIFPPGIKPGTSASWRGSVNLIKKHLIRFAQFNDKFTEEELLAATKDYVNSFNGDFQTMKTLPYFIIKNEKIYDDFGNLHYEERSLLADRVAIIQDGESTQDKRLDWTSQLS